MKLPAFVLLAIVATVFCDGNSSEESDECELTPKPINRDRYLPELEDRLAQCIVATADVDFRDIRTKVHTAEEATNFVERYCNVLPEMAECSSDVYSVAEACLNATEKAHLRATSDFFNLALHVGCEDNAFMLVEFIMHLKSGQNASRDFKEMNHCATRLGEKFKAVVSAETCEVGCWKKVFYAACTDFQKCVDDIKEGRPILRFISSFGEKMLGKMLCRDEDGSIILCNSLAVVETTN